MNRLDALFDAWKLTRDDDLPSARAHADTLLDTMRFLGLQPEWTPTDKRAFLNWCEKHGLIKKKETGQ